MQSGTIVNLHIARVKGTPSDPVAELPAPSPPKGWKAIAAEIPRNLRQVLVMDKETLDHYGLEPGQVKENITVTGLDLSQARQGQRLLHRQRGESRYAGSHRATANRVRRWTRLSPACARKSSASAAFSPSCYRAAKSTSGDSIRLEP